MYYHFLLSFCNKKQGKHSLKLQHCIHTFECFTIVLVYDLVPASSGESSGGSSAGGVAGGVIGGLLVTIVIIILVIVIVIFLR